MMRRRHISFWVCLAGVLSFLCLGGPMEAQAQSSLGFPKGNSRYRPGRVGRRWSPRVKLTLSPSHPIVWAKQKQKIYLKIGLTGFAKPTKKRAPINLAVVLDRSGSMRGAKLQKAKEATKMILELLNKDDIFSLVTYNSTVQVLIPATKLASRAAVAKKIDQIRASGFTALFGGVSKGIAEVRKFLDKKRVNRVILLSDGLANVGPSSPNALGRLGAASAKEGISITTVGLGLGYNEDLMTQLALRSDGNHGFARNAQDLARIFRSELSDVLSVVAQEIEIEIRCPAGLTPRRILGREAEIRGNTIRLKMNQLYSKQEKFALLEVDVPATNAAQSRALADVKVTYRNMLSKRREHLRASTAIQSSLQRKLVQKRVHRKVMISVVAALGNETNERAVALRDKGQVEKARKLLLYNARYLGRMAKRLGSAKLSGYSALNSTNAKNLKGRKWRKSRKVMRKYQYKIRQQQSW